MNNRADPSNPRTALRDHLQSQGARPHRRMSDLSRYMLARRDELRGLLHDEGYGWADLVAAILADDPTLCDATGKPVTAQIARLTWSRLNGRERNSGERRPKPIAAEAHSIGEAAASRPAATVSDPLSEPPPASAIRPATPRGSVTAPTRTTVDMQPTTASLDDAALDRRLAELERRQRPIGLDLPKVL